MTELTFGSKTSNGWGANLQRVYSKSAGRYNRTGWKTTDQTKASPPPSAVVYSSQQGPLQRISSLGALGEGSGWDLRIRPAPAAPPAPAAASGNLGAIFLEKKGACGNVPTSSGLPKIRGPFFWKKKGACGNVPTSSGLPEIWDP